MSCRSSGQRFYDTQLFYDPFAGPKFALYLFHAHEEGLAGLNPAAVRRRIEEARLFIEASVCLLQSPGPTTGTHLAATVRGRAAWIQ